MSFSLLVAVFIIMPILELAVLFKIYEKVGLTETVALMIITGFIGAALTKWQGMSVLKKIRIDLAEGRMPAPRLIDGVMIIVAGLLLITPGLITDTVGFLLLVPFIRYAIRMYLRRKFEKMLLNGQNNSNITFRF